MEALKKNKILLSLFAITLVVFIYFSFFKGGDDSIIESETAVSTSVAGQQIINTLAQMNTVNIDTALFTGVAWMSLQDNSSPLSGETPGKNNLFAPIGQ